MNYSEYCQKKIIPPEELSEQVKAIRTDNFSISTINGSFDLMHAGHLHILFQASQVGDKLIVALNSDESIKQYKDPSRPIIPLKNRIEMMTALSFVDYVTWFDETDPCKTLSIIRPDVHVNGSEYGHECIEAKTVKEGGGRLHLVKLIPGLSTSEIINKIQKICV